MKIDEDKIADACNEAYLRIGENAYFGNGFEAGVQFAVKELESEKQELVEVLNDFVTMFDGVLNEGTESHTLHTKAKELINRATE